MSTSDDSLRISSRVEAGSPWDGGAAVGAVRMVDTKRSRPIMAPTRLLVNSRAGDGRVAPGAWHTPGPRGDVPETAPRGPRDGYREARRMSGTVRIRDVRGGAA